MLESIAYGLAALLAYVGSQAIYVLGQAWVGRLFGLGVREITIGFGTPLYLRRFGHCRLKIGSIPLGGSTRFARAMEPNETPSAAANDDSPIDPETETAFRDSSAATRIAVLLTGPLTSLLLGVVFLSVPALMNEGQLARTTADDSAVHPCGVAGGLRIDRNPATPEGQWKLTRETALEFCYRLVTFQSLEGWGGFTAYFISAGLLGPISLGAWLSSLGVLFLCIGLLNLLPIPLYNGGHIVQVLLKSILGSQLPDRLMTICQYTGLLFFLVMFIGRTSVDCRRLWENARVFLVVWVVLLFGPAWFRRKLPRDR